ncbi:MULTISPECIES: GerAB/ArcD/ProY family transporter [Neobacillus]|nr:GerAB/ArcD/ProY family transporter [Neobacillus citreus]MCH6267343.1 spore germination protein [Neobacillus citreus]
MQTRAKENKMVSPYFLFFLIHSSQTGITVLKYQSKIIKGAGQDAWISVLLIGLSMHLVFLMMIYILKHASEKDIISFHTDTFGKFMGGMLNMMMVCYFLLAGLLVMHSYIDILQIWVFEGINAWEFSLLLCIITYYLIAGGFRVISGIAFWGVIIPSGLLLSAFYLLSYSEYSYLMPFFNHGIKDYILSAKESGPLFFGFETMLVYFPFIKNSEKSRKWGHFALLYTTILYLVITITTFSFFTQGKLKLLTWPTLTMIKIISFPFLERFEFIFLFTWLLVIIPPICLYLWASIRAIKLTFINIKPTWALFFFLLCYFLYDSILVDMYFTQVLTKLFSYSGFIFLFGYIPLLFIIAFIKTKIKNRSIRHNR